MNENNRVTDASPVEMLAEWEGPAVHEPGVLFEERQAEGLPVDADTAALAGWIAVTALSGVIGNSAYDAIKKKVLGVLAGWRRRFGQPKIDEVKQQLFLQMQQHRKNPKITDEELRERIELLFDEIQVERDMFAERPPVHVRLEIICPRGQSRYTLTLHQDGQFIGDGSLKVAHAHRQHWQEFLGSYVKVGYLADSQMEEFGRGLFTGLFANSGLADAWAVLRTSASERPVHFTVEFGPNTEELTGLPLELLHDGKTHIFSHDDFWLVRSLKETPAASFTLPDKPRLLFAWACPSGETSFDPDDHRRRLSALMRSDDFVVLPNASRDEIEQELAAGNFDILHLLAHGYPGDVALNKPAGGSDPDPVRADRLAGVVRGTRVSLVFLCSCQTGRTASGHFSGVAQRILVQTDCRVACVVAMQANLPTASSADLVQHFYQGLLERRPPAEALAHARKCAFNAGGQAWSVPILLARQSSQAPPAESNRIESEGAQARLLKCLCPLEFEADLDLHLPRFTGRDWMIAALDQWQANPAGPRAFLIAGPPGAGKTALAAWLCAHRPDVAAFHVCRYGDSERLDPRRLLQSVAYQLAMQLPDYARRLNGLPLETLTTKSARSQFDALIVQPLAGLTPPERPLLVLIDGLDEASRDGFNEVADFLGAEWGRTKPWLRLVLTSRPDLEVTFPLQALTPILLDTAGQDNENDLRKFLAHELPSIGSETVRSAAAVETVLARSEGSFLYAECVRRELAEGRLSLDRLDEFPQGLGGYYAQYFKRQFLPDREHPEERIADRKQYEERILPLLEMVAAAREPAEIPLLGELLGWDEGRRDAVLGSLGSLFVDRAGRLQPFHRSVIEWLTDPKRAGPYLVRPNQGHQRLTEAGWKRYEDGGTAALAGYVLRHLPRHLLAMNRSEDAAAMLLDWRYLEARTEAGQVLELPADLAAVAQALSANHPDWSLLASLECLVRVDLSFLIRRPQCLFQCLWNSGWWHDNPAAQRQESPHHEGPNLSAWLEQWRSKRDEEKPRPWLRSLRRPATQLGVLQAVLRGHTAALVGAAPLDAAGSCLVTAGEDGSWRVWDAHTGVERACHRGAPITALAVASAAGRVVAGRADGSIDVFDGRSGKPLAHFTGHLGRISSVAVTADGLHLVSGAVDGTVRVWDVMGEKETARLRHGSTVVDRNIYTIPTASRKHFHWCSPGETKAVAASDPRYQNESVSYPQTIVGRPGRRCLREHTQRVGPRYPYPGRCPICKSSAWGGPAGCVVTDDETGQFLVHVPLAPDEKERIYVHLVHPHPVDGHLFLPPGHLTTMVQSDGRVTTALHRLFFLHESVGRDKALEIMISILNDETTGDDIPEPPATSPRRGNYVCDTHVETIYTISRDIASEKARAVFVAVSADGTRLISGSGDNIVRLWDRESDQELATFTEPQDWITSGAFAPDGRHVAAGSVDHSVRVWDVVCAAEVARFLGHKDRVICIAFSLDGQRVASGSADATLRVWHRESGNELACLHGHDGRVTGIVWLPNGLLLSSGEDRTARLWRVPDQSAGAATWEHQGPILHMAFNDAGEYLTTRSKSDPTELRWRIPDATWRIPAATCRIVSALPDDAPLPTAESVPLPWEAAAAQGVTIVRDTSTNAEVACYPGEMALLVRHPDLPLWAGAAGNRLHLFQLEGVDVTLPAAPPREAQRNEAPLADATASPKPQGLLAARRRIRNHRLEEPAESPKPLGMLATICRWLGLGRSGS